MQIGSLQVVPDNEYENKDTDSSQDKDDSPKGLSEFERKLMEANAEHDAPIKPTKSAFPKRRVGQGPPIRQLARDAQALTPAEIRAITRTTLM